MCRLFRVQTLVCATRAARRQPAQAWTLNGWANIKKFRLQNTKQVSISFEIWWKVQSPAFKRLHRRSAATMPPEGGTLNGKSKCCITSSHLYMKSAIGNYKVISFGWMNEEFLWQADFGIMWFLWDILRNFRFPARSDKSNFTLIP